MMVIYECFMCPYAIILTSKKLGCLKSNKQECPEYGFPVWCPLGGYHQDSLYISNKNISEAKRMIEDIVKTNIEKDGNNERVD